MDFRLKIRPNIENLIRDHQYIIDHYDIREGIFYFYSEINFTNTKKYFGFTKNNIQNIIITEQFISEFNQEFAERIEFLIALIDSDIVLVENTWIEIKEKSNSNQL